MLKVSVVIPTFNRADLLARTIDKIEHQTLERELYEVIVIDNDSSDQTQSVLDQKSRTYSNLKAFSQSKRGAAATQGSVIPPIKHLGPGFSRMRVLCGAREIAPIHPFRIRTRVSDTEAVDEGAVAWSSRT